MLSRLWRDEMTRLKLGLFIFVFAYYFFLTLHRYHLVVAADEVGFVSNAWFLSGVRHMFHMTSASYYPWGYSLLIAPVFWVTKDPYRSYHLAVVINCILVGITALNLFSLWNRYASGLRWLGIFSCCAICLYPALQLNAGLLWAETCFTAVFSLYINVTSALLRGGRLNLALASVFLSVYLYAIHERALLLPFISLLPVAYLTIRGRCTRATLVLSAAVVALGVIGVRTANAFFQLEGWDPAATAANGVDAHISGLLNFNGVKSILRSALGQVWYLSFSTLGFFLVAWFGVFLALAKIWKSPRNREVNDGIALDREWSEFSFFLFFAFSAIFIASAAAMAGAIRADHFLYGRYIEVTIPVVLLYAVLTLVREDFFTTEGFRWAAISTGFIAVLALGLNYALPVSKKLAVLQLTIPSTIILPTGGDLASTLATGTFIVVLFSSIAAFLNGKRVLIQVGLLALVFLCSGISAASLVGRMATSTLSQLASVIDAASHFSGQKAYFIFSSKTASAYYHLQAYMPAWDFLSVSSAAAKNVSGFVVAGDEWGAGESSLRRYKVPSASEGPLSLWYQGDPTEALKGHPWVVGAEAMVPSSQDLYLASGVYGLERRPKDFGRWTNGLGRFLFDLPKASKCTISMRLANLARHDISLDIDADDRHIYDLKAGEVKVYNIEIGPSRGIAEIKVASDTFVPGNGDNRKLGVMVTSLKLDSCEP